MNKTRDCTSCQMNYHVDEPCCPFCDEPPPMYIEKSKSTLHCKKCGFQNHLSNLICLACDGQMFEEKEQNKKKCDHCKMEVKQSLYQEHTVSCMLSQQLVNLEKEQSQRHQQYLKTLQDCKYCFIKFPKQIISEHYQVCVLKPFPKNPLQVVGVVEPFQVSYNTDIKQSDLFSNSQIPRLTKLQRGAIMHMQDRSMKQSTKVKKQVEERCRKLGYKKQDLQNLLFYIQNYAPIIIHIHITKHMQFFIKDTHYRSQFQTGKSSGSLSRQSRTTWQDRMFDKKYSKATDYERVKYGVINFTNDPKGVNCALAYGLSYFLLKQNVRNRCTITDMDSSNTNSLIGTFKYCLHILNKMNDSQLKSAFKAAKAMEQSSKVTTTYKQIQIHGPIEFAKDVQRIYVNKNEVKDKTYLDMVYSFCDKNKIQYEFI